MADPNTTRRSVAMERTGQWVFSQDLPSDLIIDVGDTSFSLHKFMLAPKSKYIRQLIMECDPSDLTRIDLSDIPGGPKIFEKAVKFCYGVNFEITVYNVAALRCAAEYLEMTDEYCPNSLAGRTEDFLSQVALSSFTGAVLVLKSCQKLLPFADDLNLVKRCVEAVSSKACSEANFPSRSPPNWWAEELAVLDFHSFGQVINSMRKRGAKSSTIARALVEYTEQILREEVVPNQSSHRIKSSEDGTELGELLQSIVSLFPSEKSAFPVSFLCYLLRCAITLGASTSCRSDLEKRISAILEHVTVDDLLVLSFTRNSERLFDLDSVRRVISRFVEKEKNVAVFNVGEFKEVYSSGMHRVAKTVDAYLAEIAVYDDLNISKFKGIAVLIPKGAREVDDDLYRAIDLYLKAHPNLDEIEREKVCSVMDPLKLSYEARVHASQSRSLPVQIVLHALYYDQLKLRSGAEEAAAATGRIQMPTDASLMRENEELRTELLRMKMCLSELQHNKGLETTSLGIGGSESGPRKSRFFSSVSKKLSKLNPFKHGSKDTSNIDDGPMNVVKPRGRRFSIS